MSACDGVEQLEPGQQPPTQDEPSLQLPAVPAAVIELARFEGVADAATGRFEITTLPSRTPEGLDATDGLRALQQALWCEIESPADGMPGAGPPGTVELLTLGPPVLSFPFEDLPTGCRSPDGVVEAGLAATGVLCAQVRLQSFVDGPLSNVHVELVEFGGTPLQRGARFPAGTGAEPPSGVDALSDEYGLWRHGDLGAAGGGSDIADQLWVFQNGAPGPFTFRGRVLATAPACDTGGAP
jgi:hypothetical protein